MRVVVLSPPKKRIRVVVVNGKLRPMNAEQIQQKAWLDRLNYTVPLHPTLQTLNGLVFAHAHAISYETLDIMLGRPPRLDVGTLQNKMIYAKRGGYCFE